MKEELIAAVLNARVACALIHRAGLQAENEHAVSCGNSIPNGEGEFNRIIEENGIHHNAVFTTIEELRDP